MDVTTAIFVTLVMIVGSGLVYVRVIEPLVASLRETQLMSRFLHNIMTMRLSERLIASESDQTDNADQTDRGQTGSDRPVAGSQTGSDRPVAGSQTGSDRPVAGDQTGSDEKSTGDGGHQDGGRRGAKASLETVALLRKAGVTREQAREILRSVGLALDNNVWRQAGTEEGAQDVAVTPVAGRPYNPALYRDL